MAETLILACSEWVCGIVMTNLTGQSHHRNLPCCNQLREFAGCADATAVRDSHGVGNGRTSAASETRCLKVSVTEHRFKPVVILRPPVLHLSGCPFDPTVTPSSTWCGSPTHIHAVRCWTLFRAGMTAPRPVPRFSNRTPPNDPEGLDDETFQFSGGLRIPKLVIHAIALRSVRSDLGCRHG